MKLAGEKVRRLLHYPGEAKLQRCLFVFSMKSLEKIRPVQKGERKPNSKAAKRKAVYDCGQRREKADHLSRRERVTGVQERGESPAPTAH